MLWIKHSFPEWSLSHSVPLSTLPSSLPQQCRLIIKLITHTRPCGSARWISCQMPEYWGHYALLRGGDENYFPLCFTESSKVAADKQPSAGEKGCPPWTGRPFQSVLPAVDEVPDILTSGRGGGGVHSHHCSQGRSKHVPRSHASHRQFYWAGKLTANIITARTLVPNIPPALFQTPCWTHLPASAVDSQLSCTQASGHFWDLNS